MSVDMALNALPNNPMNFTENQHGNAILEKLRCQKEGGRFCDVVIYVQGKQFQAHRNVLSACSPYFESILKVQKAVKEQLTVTCQNYEAFHCLLNYMYTGTVVVDKNNVAELLRLANHFLVTKLKSYCAEYLDRYLNVENCVSVKELADKYGMPALLKNAVNFIQAHMSDVLQQKELLDASLSKVEQFLSDKSWNIPQDGLLKFVCQWVAYNPTFRDRELRNLLTFVNWHVVERHLLSVQLENEILFKQNPRCLYFILQSMEENGVHLPKYAGIYQELKTKFGPEASTNFDSDSFLNMAISTAIEGLQDVNGPTPERERDTTFDPVTVTPLNTRTASQLRKKCKNDEVGSQQPNGLTKPKSGRSKLVTASFILHGGKRVRPIRLRLGAVVRRKLRNGLCASVSTVDGRKLRLFKLRNGLLRHLKRNCNQPSSTNSKSTTQDGVEECHEEDDDYDDIDDIINAIDGRIDKKPGDFIQDCIKCPHCLYVANSIQRLERHVSRAHSRDVTYKCGLCEFTCKWNRDYYGHMKERHFPGPPFRCDGCDYTCEQIQMLLTHRLRHTDERPYKCSKCDFRCRTKNNLWTHSRTHANEKPFKCHICYRSFAVKSTLEHHLTTHNEDRQYVCDVCNFSTKFQSHLLTHKKVHTNELFRCEFPECSYTSPKKSQITAHNRTHTAVRTHICGVCGRGFVEKSHLVRHERIHLNEKPFKCDHCDYSSSRRDKLKEHTTKHHGAHPTAKTPYKPRKARAITSGSSAGNNKQHFHHHHHPYDQSGCYPGGSIQTRTNDLDPSTVLHANHNQQHPQQNQSQQIQQQTSTPSSSISETSPSYSYDPQSSQHHLVAAMDLHSKVILPDLSRSLAAVAAAAAAGVDPTTVSQAQSQVNNQQSITSVASGLPPHSHAAAVAAAAVAASGRGQPPPTMVFDPRYHATAPPFHHHMPPGLDQRPQQPGIHNLNTPNPSNMPHSTDFSGLSAFMALF